MTLRTDITSDDTDHVEQHNEANEAILDLQSASVVVVLELDTRGVGHPWWQTSFVAWAPTVRIDVEVAGQMDGWAWGWHYLAVGIPGASGRLLQRAPNPDPPPWNPPAEDDATVISVQQIGQTYGEPPRTFAATCIVEGLTPGVEYTVDLETVIIGAYDIQAMNDTISKLGVSYDEQVLVAAGFISGDVDVFLKGAHWQNDLLNKSLTMKRVGRFNIGAAGSAFTQMVAMDPNAATGHRGAAVQIGAGVVAVFDVREMALVRTIAKPGGESGNLVACAWRPGGQMLYVGSSTGKVWPLDLSTDTWGSALTVDGASGTVYDMRFTADGATLWVSCSAAGTIRPITFPSGVATVGTAVTVGGTTGTPHQLAIEADGSVWVACNGTAGRVDHVVSGAVAESIVVTGERPHGVGLYADDEMIVVFTDGAGATNKKMHYFTTDSLEEVEPPGHFIVDSGGGAVSTVGMAFVSNENHIYSPRDDELHAWPQGRWYVDPTVTPGTNLSRPMARLTVTGGLEAT